MSVSSDDGSSPRTTPSPTTLERSDSDRTDWDGLNLSLTAREMRERIGSKKKADPRKDKLDMRKKFDIIQTLWTRNGEEDFFLWKCSKQRPTYIRVHLRFEFLGSKFKLKYDHCSKISLQFFSYQNYEQSWQKLGTILEEKNTLKDLTYQKMSIIKIVLLDFSKWFDWFWHWKITLKIRFALLLISLTLDKTLMFKFSLSEAYLFYQWSKLQSYVIKSAP